MCKRMCQIFGALPQVCVIVRRHLIQQPLSYGEGLHCIGMPAPVVR